MRTAGYLLYGVYVLAGVYYQGARGASTTSKQYIETHKVTATANAEIGDNGDCSKTQGSPLPGDVVQIDDLAAIYNTGIRGVSGGPGSTLTSVALELGGALVAAPHDLIDGAVPGPRILKASVAPSVQPRGEDGLNIFDRFGDYGYHDVVTAWAPFDPGYRYPPQGAMNVALGVYRKIPSWDAEHDPSWRPRQKTGNAETEMASKNARAIPSQDDPYIANVREGENRSRRFWAQEFHLQNPQRWPAVAGGLPIFEKDGYDIPAAWEFQHRKFNRSESTYAIRYYKIRVFDPDCIPVFATNCHGSSSSGSDNLGPVVETNNDYDVYNCLLALPQRCPVSIYGFTNFTAHHAPDICCSNILAMTLPVPGRIVPRQDCTYGDITVHNFVPLGSIRDSNYGVPQLLQPKEWHAAGIHVTDAWNQKVCVQPAAEPYLRGCSARIEFGDQLFTRPEKRDSHTNYGAMVFDEEEHTKQSMKTEENRADAFPAPFIDREQVCQPPDFLRGSVLAPNRDYTFYASEYTNLERSIDSQNFQHYMMDSSHLNLVLKIQQLRERLQAQSASQFSAQFTPSADLSWCGPFAGISVPIKCETHGLEGFFTHRESPGVEQELLARSRVNR